MAFPGRGVREAGDRPAVPIVCILNIMVATAIFMVTTATAQSGSRHNCLSRYAARWELQHPGARKTYLAGQRS
jgi:hypothetical protein